MRESDRQRIAHEAAAAHHRENRITFWTLLVVLIILILGAVENCQHPGPVPELCPVVQRGMDINAAPPHDTVFWVDRHCAHEVWRSFSDGRKVIIARDSQ